MFLKKKKINKKIYRIHQFFCRSPLIVFILVFAILTERKAKRKNKHWRHIFHYLFTAKHFSWTFFSFCVWRSRTLRERLGEKISKIRCGSFWKAKIHNKHHMAMHCAKNWIVELVINKAIFWFFDLNAFFPSLTPFGANGSLVFWTKRAWD